MKKLLEELKGKANNKQSLSRFINGAIKKNPELLDEIIKQTKFLDEHYEKVTLSLRTWHIWTDEGIQYCPICGEKGRKINYENDRFHMYYDTCGKECSVAKRDVTNLKKYGGNPLQNEAIKAKIDATNLEKFGGNPSQNEAVKAKRDATNLKKYGGNPSQNEAVKAKLKATFDKRFGGHPSQNEDVKVKIKATFEEKYGGNPSQNEAVKAKRDITYEEKYGGHPMQNEAVKAKRDATNLKKYGGNPSQNESVKAKGRATSLERYDTEHPMQNLEIMKRQQKAALTPKPYELPSGTIIDLQGYENFYLDKYFANGFPESDIQHEPFNIPYTFKGKTHYYTPDLFIPSKNLIIEVKSTWTLNRDFDENLIKMQACIDAGYNFQFAIYDRKGNEMNFRDAINMRKFVPKKSAPKSKAS